LRTDCYTSSTILSIAASLATLAILALCAACAQPTAPPPTSTPSPTPSPTPEPKVLTVCLPDEPEGLYLYGTASMAARHVWQAIYDGPLDSRNYAYQPVILTAIPDLADGSAAVEAVTVQASDRVLAASGEVVELTPGVTVSDAGGERVTFDGTPMPMQRMVVTFTLQPDVYWSDGALLTADDSVFSFELASDLNTPTDKHVVERTASYRAADVRTVVWSGVPGFLDQAYFLNFWHPLPRHAWGHLSAAELLTAEASTRQPLGWGPFVLREWTPGDHITVARNPIYFRAPQGLPRLDEVTFRFITDPATLTRELVGGRCDVVTHDAADTVRAALPDPSPVELLSTYDARWELLAFGISPAIGYDRPDFFEDVRVRQAVALCIDRQAVVNQVLGSPDRVAHSTIPPEHPLYASEALVTWGYATAAGGTLLATVGWYDEDGDGVREAHNIPGIADGTPFQVTYHTTDEPPRVQTAQAIQTYLAECGIQASVETVPPESLFAPGPEGVLFGRRFDLAQFAWRAQSDPLCDLFLSSQIPGPGNWDRPNVAGFIDDAYDTACQSALDATPGSREYAAGHAEAQRIFSERLPVLPLFQRLKVTLARSPIIGLAPDPTQDSELWNIEQLDLRP
jgi:peptide/nickel transport system substrate-binding protein